MKHAECFCLAFFIALAMAGRSDAAKIDNAEESSFRVNYLFYQRAYENGCGLVRVIPLFTHRYDNIKGQHSTFIWPLLSSGGRRREEDGRYTSQIVPWPLLTSYTWGRDGDEHWDIFSNIVVTQVNADVSDPIELRPFFSAFYYRWMPVMRPIFRHGVEGRQQLHYTGIRLLFGYSSQRGERGSSLQFGLFPLVSISKRDAFFPMGKDAGERHINEKTLTVPILLAGRDRYHEQRPGGAVDSSRYDLIWPLFCSRKTTFTPTASDKLPSVRRYNRLLPIYSKESSPGRGKFTFWPLLMRWERTEEGKFFRPLLFLKFKTGE